MVSYCCKQLATFLTRIISLITVTIATGATVIEEGDDVGKIVPEQQHKKPDTLSLQVPKLNYMTTILVGSLTVF